MVNDPRFHPRRFIPHSANPVVWIETIAFDRVVNQLRRLYPDYGLRS